jgi:hypothetical protein
MGEKGEDKDQYACKCLKRNYRCEKTCDELNELIKKATEFIKEDNTANFYIFNEHKDLIISHLKEKTNINKKLSDLKSSDSFLHNNFLGVLVKLKDVDENGITDKFMKLLDLALNNVEKTKIKDYKFIILLNIKKFRDIDLDHGLEILKEEFEIYNNILDLFKLKRTTYEKYFNNVSDKADSKKIESPEDLFREILYRYESNYGEIIEFNVEARDIGFAITKANKIIESFLGFLSFFRYHYVNSFRLTFDDDSSIDKIKSISYIILKDGEIIPYPRQTPTLKLYSIKKDLELSEGSIDLKITDNLTLIQDLSKIIKKIKNDNKNKLWEKLMEFLVLYYSACSEKNLSYSFLQFWTLSENIIKYITGSLNDKMLLRIMTKILKSRVTFSIGKHIGKRIEYLHYRRNRLVHEGKLNEISEEDRKITKLIADSVLNFYISNLETLDNIEEYNFILQNMKKTDRELERYSGLLNDLLEKKIH